MLRVVFAATRCDVSSAWDAEGRKNANEKCRKRRPPSADPCPRRHPTDCAYSVSVVFVRIACAKGGGIQKHDEKRRKCRCRRSAACVPRREVLRASCIRRVIVTVTWRDLWQHKSGEIPQSAKNATKNVDFSGSSDRALGAAEASCRRRAFCASSSRRSRTRSQRAGVRNSTNASKMQ